MESFPGTAGIYLDGVFEECIPIPKGDDATRAWFVTIDEEEQFAKSFPLSVRDRAEVEIAISGQIRHPAMIPLLRVVECADGLLLFHPRVYGTTLSGNTERARFYALPYIERVTALTAVFEALAAICDAGWVLVDVYEGNILYNFDTRQVYVFDFDLCRFGDGFQLPMDRNYGSSRLMAPEEWGKGNWIDQCSNVFNLARIAELALHDDISPALLPVLKAATQPDRALRHATVREFVNDFKQAVHK